MGAQLPTEEEPCALCSHRPGQGPFVHLTVMIAAYLGRVRTKATGETEVRGSERAPRLEGGEGRGRL